MSRMDLKPRILSVIGVVIFGTLLMILSMKIDAENMRMQNSVISWLENFCVKDFDACDSLVYNYKSSFESIRVSDERYYNTMLSALVDSITYIEVQSITQKDNGVLEYEVYIEYKPYKYLDKLEIPDMSGIIAKYKSDEISDVDFMKELERVYFEVYCNNCFQLENDTTRSQVLILSEKNVDGVTRVYNTVSFVDSLLSDSNITGNVSFYEENIKEEISYLIKTN